MSDQCEVKRCRQSTEGSSGVIYSASKSGRKREVCNRHLDQHCQGLINLKSKKTFTVSK